VFFAPKTAECWPPHELAFCACDECYPPCRRHGPYSADAGRSARTKQRRRCVLAGPGRSTAVALLAEALTMAAQTAELLRLLLLALAHWRAGRRRTDSPPRCWPLLWRCFNDWCAGRRRTDGPAQRLRKLSLPRTHSASLNSTFAKNGSAFLSAPVGLARLHVTANVGVQRTPKAVRCNDGLGRTCITSPPQAGTSLGCCEPQHRACT
jgi:hypothetical protein